MPRVGPSVFFERQPVLTALRFLIAVVGGYALTAGYIAFGGLAFAWFGLPRSEASSLSILSGFLVYLAVVLWAAATRHPWRAGASVLAIAAFLVLIPMYSEPQVS